MTLEQKRAAAFTDIEAFAQLHPNRDAAERKRYGSLACKLPALLLSAGLCQALHFLKSRPAKSQASVSLDHLAKQLQCVFRPNPATGSEGRRPGIPIEGGQ